MTRSRDIVSASALIVISVVVFFASDHLVSRTRMEIGPSFMPKVLAVLTFVLSVVMLIGALRQGIAQQLSVAAAQRGGRSPLAFLERRADWVSLLLIFGYTVAFQPLGYIVATSLYLFLQFIVMAPAVDRKYVRFAAIAVVVSLATYYVFLKGFYVFLPDGPFG